MSPLDHTLSIVQAEVEEFERLTKIFYTVADAERKCFDNYEEMVPSMETLDHAVDGALTAKILEVTFLREQAYIDVQRAHESVQHAYDDFHCAWQFEPNSRLAREAREEADKVNDKHRVNWEIAQEAYDACNDDDRLEHFNAWRQKQSK